MNDVTAIQISAATNDKAKPVDLQIWVELIHRLCRPG